MLRSSLVEARPTGNGKIAIYPVSYSFWGWKDLDSAASDIVEHLESFIEESFSKETSRCISIDVEPELEYGNIDEEENHESLFEALASRYDYEIPDSVPQLLEHEWSHPDFVPPLTTFYTVEDDYNFRNGQCRAAEYICWPTIAPSSIDIVVGQGSLAGWGRSLLVPSLKEGAVYRVALDDGGVEKLWSSIDRYRDIAVAPDAHTFYVVTDNEGATSGPTTGVSFDLEHPGAILEFSYEN